jgi:CDGSH-type Zn-finger protein
MPFEEREKISSSAKLAELLRIVQTTSGSKQHEKSKLVAQRRETPAEQKEARRRARTICACGHSEKLHNGESCASHHRKLISSCRCVKFVPGVFVSSSQIFMQKLDPSQLRHAEVHPSVVGFINLENHQRSAETKWLTSETCLLCEKSAAMFVFYDRTRRCSVPVCRDHGMLAKLLILPSQVYEELKNRAERDDPIVTEFVPLALLEEAITAAPESDVKIKAFDNVRKNKTKKQALPTIVGVEGLTYTSDTSPVEISNWIFDEVLNQTPETARFAVIADPTPQNFDSPQDFEQVVELINQIRFDFGIRLQRKCKERAPHLTVDQLLENLYRSKRIPWRTVEN